jgi:hypothetical protein
LVTSAGHLDGCLHPTRGRVAVRALGHEGDAAPRVQEESVLKYWVRVEVAGDPLAVRGSRLINESSWDDGLPLRVDGRDAYGGMYTGINQELYWADDEDSNQNGRSDKLERIVDSLDRGDYFITSIGSTAPSTSARSLPPPPPTGPAVVPPTPSRRPPWPNRRMW